MATQESRSAEERLAEVLELLRALTRRVDDLDARLGALETGAPVRPTPAATKLRVPAVDSASVTMGQEAGESSQEATIRRPDDPGR